MSDWRLGIGYSGYDMLWLFEQVRKRIQLEKLPRGYRFSEQEVETMLTDLDKRRGEIPRWRKSAE